MKKLITFLIGLSPFLCLAQSPGSFLKSPVQDEVDKFVYKNSDSLNLHSSFKPYNDFKVSEVANEALDEMKFEKEPQRKVHSWLFNKLFNEDFINIRSKDDDDFSLRINPLIHLRFGDASDTEDLVFTNTRGVQVMGNIGKKVRYYSDFYENQARYPEYINEWIRDNRVVPGQGFPKTFDSVLTEGAEGFDFANASGFVSYQASKHFNFQFGHGKNFIGDGYRSLLLSDNAFNYAYFKIQTSFWKIQYTNLYARMTSIRDTYGSFEKKYMASHHLSYNVTRNFNIGLYESVIFRDTSGGFDLNYLNPVILYRPIEFAVNSRDANVILGLTMSYTIKDKSKVYGQFVLDEFKFDNIRARNGWWANKFGFQLGVKSYDFIIPGLFVQTEFNWVRPFTYTHNTKLRNYGHYNQALAHPLGANFMESVTRVSYQKKRWYGEVELMYASQGRDTLGSNWGTNIFLNNTTREQDFGNELGQGVNSKTLFVDLKGGFIVNPRTNLRIELGLNLRTLTPEMETADLEKANTTFFYFGLNSAINNRYYDF